jgi:Membrane-bound metallopeptidase
MEEMDEEMLEFERKYGKRDEEKKSGAAKILAIALGVVAAALLATLVIVLMNKKALVNDLNSEKEDLTNELVALHSDYETLSTTNAAINDSLTVEKEKVEQLIDRLQKTEATNRAKIRQYEKELGTLRTIMKGYIKQIDSLNTVNTSLRREASAAKQEAAESRRQYDQLRVTTDEYAKKATAGAVVKGRGVVLTAINSSNKETDRSSRTEKLKTCLSLIENAIATKGPKVVYIRVKGPDGILMAGEQQRVFSCGGEEMIYSASREVDYQGEEVEICVYFANVGGFEKGVYTVDVYTSETKIGSADLLLR